MGKRIDLKGTEASVGSGYPTPYGAPCAARVRRRLGDAADLTDFGVNLLRLPPGTWSSQRHWHSADGRLCGVQGRRQGRPSSAKPIPD
jgi:uncharacterized cupin superfamily protein